MEAGVGGMLSLLGVDGASLAARLMRLLGANFSDIMRGGRVTDESMLVSRNSQTGWQCCVLCLAAVEQSTAVPFRPLPLIRVLAATFRHSPHFAAAVPSPEEFKDQLPPGMSLAAGRDRLRAAELTGMDKQLSRVTKQVWAVCPRARG